MRHYRLAVIVIYSESQTIIMDFLLNNALAVALALASASNAMFISIFTTDNVQLLHDFIVVLVLQFYFVAVPRR